MDISAFSMRQTAGQRLMVGFDGIELDSELKYLIDSIKVGGVILFSRNISDPDQVRRLCSSIQDHASACGQPPLMIAVDQEGGQVARLKAPFTQFPGNPHMKSLDDAVHFAEVTAKELGRVGINMNMAPVLDVAPMDIQSVMAGRVFGDDPDRVCEYGKTVIEGLQNGGISAVGKHFPGIGRTVLDSHIDLPTSEADMEELDSFDLPPFKSAIAHRVSGIMLSHIRYVKIDSEWPASLSPRIAKEILRDILGFEGIVITDDLDMGAIQKYFDVQTVVRQVLSAEIDIALICHRTAKIEQAVEEIIKATTDSRETRLRGEASLKRILELKKRYLGI
jgi:beta-N-acetylhexosaminidase